VRYDFSHILINKLKTGGKNMKPLQRLAGVAVMFMLIFWNAEIMAKEIVIGYTGPLSGPAAEYGQENLNGVDMAVKELNAAGGIRIKGERYFFKLISIDDRTDPTQAVNNARRFRNQYNAIAVFSPVFTCIAPILGINEEKGQEFLVMAYTSTPKLAHMNNKLMVMIPPPFTVYVHAFSDLAWKQGWRKAAMLITLGAYGDEWRKTFKGYWEKIGGTLVADKPANYYKETDFSSQLTAIMATKPQLMVIGGPSAPTALVIEQARAMDFKGGFILIEQARADYVKKILKGTKLMENVIGQGAVDSLPFAAAPSWHRRYNRVYKLAATLGTVQNYDGMHALARAIEAADTADNVTAIRAAFSKAFPMLGNKFPAEMLGISNAGSIRAFSYVQMVKHGKFSKPEVFSWWPKTEHEFDQIKKTTKCYLPLRWIKIEE
jgi:branched-chain amino acid transport system substrate-binding protein